MATDEAAASVLPFFEARTFAVPARLAPWVEHIWVNRPTPLSKGYHFFRPPEVVTHLAFTIGSSSSTSDGRTLVDRAQTTASGVQSRLYPVPFPVSEALVFQLRPGAARALQLPARALANEQVDVRQLSLPWARDLTERLAAGDRTERRVHSMCDLLAPHFLAADPDAQLVRRARAFAQASTAHQRTDDLAHHIGYSERQLRRIFSDTFGLNPKDLLKVLRMNAVLHALGASRDWAGVASQHGYHDQSHLIHEFALVVGHPPERFVRTLAEPRLFGGATVVCAAGLGAAGTSPEPYLEAL